MLDVTNRRALVVDDEPDIRDILRVNLEKIGFQTVEVGDGADAVENVQRARFDVVVLDLLLPGLDGLSVCRTIRRQSLRRDVPILVVTARRSMHDAIIGLEAGADDYLAKPFGIQELVARVTALVRRAEGAYAPTPAQRLEVGTLEIDRARRRLSVQGTLVKTTRLEFELLLLMAQQPGVVFSRRRLLQRLWPEQTFVTDRSVDAVVKRIRKKVEEATGSADWLETARGEGYRIVCDDDHRVAP